MPLLRQAATLVGKDLLIIVRRRWLSTALRALALPIVYMWFISYVRNFFLPPSVYGVGEPRPLRDIGQVFNGSVSLGGRNTVAFVNNAFYGGQIEDVITALATSFSDLGVQTHLLESDDSLFEVCRSSLRGSSSCYGAVSFHSSPSEGPDGTWNYTAISDFGLSQRVFVDQDDNDAEIFILPFLHAINSQLAAESGASLPSQIRTYPFTSQTRQDRDNQIQTFFMRALVNYLGVVFFIGICGVAYHLPGNLSAERESGISQLIDVMIPTRRQWHSQMLRLWSKHLAFDIVYVPGLLAIGGIVASLVFENTDATIVVLYHLLAGLALTSYALFAGTFFRRSQLSGITVLIISLVLAIVAQFIVRSNAVAIALSLIFPSVNYTLFIIFLASWERSLTPADLLRSPPFNGSNSVPGYVFFVLLGVQFFVYPILALASESLAYGISAKHRDLTMHGGPKSPAIQIHNLSKHYSPRWWQWGKEIVRAVDDLSFTAIKGQIVMLLGANGSGKSTTLSAISGVHSITGGNIRLDGAGGLGLCPQKNVLWDDLTVTEHVRIFNRLKSQSQPESSEQIRRLISACDLELKANKKAKTLSGGQKRKLQLAIAFIGGSQVCCIDEVSSGVDPLSRRKLWEILLQEKGKRTFLLATHALDEADALSDAILMLSKGTLRAFGASAQLKHEFGGGYRIVTPKNWTVPDSFASQYEFQETPDGLQFTLRSATEASQLCNDLETMDIRDYEVLSPSIEDVFLNLADEIRDEKVLSQVRSPLSSSAITRTDGESSNSNIVKYSVPPKDTRDLATGTGTNLLQQAWIVFNKRVRVLSRNFLPYCFAIIVPILTAGLTTFFLSGFEGLSCTLGANANNPNVATLPVLDFWWGLDVPIGPANQVDLGRLPAAYAQYSSRLALLPDFDAFQAYIQARYSNVVPGGYFIDLENPPLLAYRANGGAQYAALAKIALDSYLTELDIISQFSTFALPLAASTGDSLQLVLYFTFSMCAACGFFTLYPTFERLSKVRALHYSNGVRAAPLWLANAAFDGLFVLIISGVSIALLVGTTNLWFQPGYLFVIFFLYGIASTLLAYIVSLFVTSQLAAFAFAAGGQAIFALIYFILYMVLITFSQPEALFRSLNAVQFSYGLLTPSGNLVRALLLGLNQSQLLCRNQGYISYGGNIEVYGAPILYLTLQTMAAYAFLVWYDSGWRPRIGWSARLQSRKDVEKDAVNVEPDVMEEISRAETSTDGLRVLHLSKRFKKDTVVDDVTFGVQHGEVFALLGPNGAGKSTTISLVRGDLSPSSPRSDVLIEGASITTEKAAARQNLGVCPQFDAMDRMTVTEHLKFYAKVRGVADIESNVKQVISAVGLDAFRNRPAARLSGGNQRKLSLGIAIIGNPSILLLDEPSSGMDAVAKRVMWKTLEGIKVGRSLVITTHSMEEASALSDRVGILAKRMLALGTTNTLRKRHGDAYYVHLVHVDGPHMTDEDGDMVEKWFFDNIPAAEKQTTSLHGQFRFIVPKTAELADGRMSNIGGLLLKSLEHNKSELKIRYYTFSETTLEDVFLTVVGTHRIEEEETSILQ